MYFTKMRLKLSLYSILLRIVASTVVCCATLSLSQTDKTPQSVVEQYCLLDARGANFSASNPNAKAIYKLLVNENEAAPDTSVIIQSYRIGKSKIGARSADVEVIYSDLGLISAGDLTEQRKTESVIFHLTMVDTTWKIDGLRILPHISKDWLLSDIRKGLNPDQARASDPNRELSRW